MDASEAIHPSRPVACFRAESADFTNEILVVETTIWLEKHVGETDRYDRLLRYVWVEPSPDNEAWEQLVEDGLLDEEAVEDSELILFNQLLVEARYAVPSTYAPDVKYQDHEPRARWRGS